jgi:hypothetical protein
VISFDPRNGPVNPISSMSFRTYNQEFG